MSVLTESRAADPIPFARPYIGREEEEAAIRVLRSGWLTTGKEALAFEKEFEAFLGAAGVRALAVNSATSGLHLAMEACGVASGDVVLTSPYTFTSTAEVVRYLGADVAFVDVGEGSYLMDPAALERTVARLEAGLPAYPPRLDASAEERAAGGFGPVGRPAVIAPVHVGGLPCDMDAIMAIARAHGLRVVEDAAHAFPSRFADGRYAGTIGDIGVFSFYATKPITPGEGGMVVTRDETLAARIGVMRSHGIDRSIWNRYTDAKASWRYAVVEPGYKYNLPDLLAAVGRVQLGRAEALLAMRQEIAARYDDAFRDDGRFLIPPTGQADARHLYTLRIAEAARDAFIEALQEVGVGVSVHFIPLHTMPYYARRYGLRPGDFPASLATFQSTVSLPIWPGMDDAQVDRVIAAVRSVADAAGLRKAR